MANRRSAIVNDFDRLISNATRVRAARGPRAGAARRAVQHEKFEQQKGVDLLRSIGGRVYVFGTRRSKGTRCPKCAEFVPNKDRGTRQSEGIPDVLAFLRPHDVDLATQRPRRRILWWEAKRPGGGAESDDQAEFRQLCADSATDHCLGDVDDLMAWLVDHGYLKADNLPHYRRASLTRRMVNS